MPFRGACVLEAITHLRVLGAVQAYKASSLAACVDSGSDRYLKE